MSSEAGWIAVVGWDRFQHYKDRDVLWVKVYTRLLHDEAYVSLTLAERGLLHGIWLEYASTSCQLPANTLTLSRRLGSQVLGKQLEALIQAGFLVRVASKTLASRYHDASAHALAERREDRDIPKDVREGANVERPQDFTHELNGGEPSEMPELEQPASELVESDNDPVTSLTDRLSKGIRSDVRSV